MLQRICRPLGMTNTLITLTPELRARLATGYNAAGEPVANWDMPTLAGAGALRSTANDMLKFVAANLGLTKSDLWPAMQLAQAPRHEASSPAMPDTQIGLCWHVSNQFGTEVIWHNGGTGGYHSFIGFDQKNRRGVVVLSNSAHFIDDIGFHLLEPKYPLAHFEPAKERVAIHLEPEILDRYVGRYELKGTGHLLQSAAGWRQVNGPTHGPGLQRNLPGIRDQLFLQTGQRPNHLQHRRKRQSAKSGAAPKRPRPDVEENLR